MSSVACFLLNVVGRFLPIFVVACCMLYVVCFLSFLARHPSRCAASAGVASQVLRGFREFIVGGRWLRGYLGFQPVLAAAMLLRPSTAVVGLPIRIRG
jgi:hypothetical protein